MSLIKISLYNFRIQCCILSKFIEREVIDNSLLRKLIPYAASSPSPLPLSPYPTTLPLIRRHTEPSNCCTISSSSFQFHALCKTFRPQARSVWCVLRDGTVPYLALALAVLVTFNLGARALFTSGSSLYLQIFLALH